LASGTISWLENRVWADCGSRLAGLSDAEAREVWLAAWRQRLAAGDPPWQNNLEVAGESGDVPVAEEPQAKLLVGPKIGRVLRRRGVPQASVAVVGGAGDEAVRAGAARDSVIAAIIAAVEAVPERAGRDQVVEAALRAC
jgi:hypothetical protein